MAMLICSGEIDLSVAAIIALASTAMGYAAEAGAGVPALVLTGLGTGLALRRVQRVADHGAGGCRRSSRPSARCPLFRGIAYIVLGDGAYSSYPADFAWFGPGLPCGG